MATTHAVALKVGDPSQAITGWDEVAITHDILSGPSSYSVTLWRESVATRWEAVRGMLRLYAPAFVEIDGAVQMRGEIEHLRFGADRSGAPITVGGRDLAGAALEAHVDPALSLRGLTLSEALERIFAPLGIPVTIGLTADEARTVQAGARPGPVRTSSTSTRRRHHQRVDRFRYREGMTVWEAAETLCRRHGFLLYPAPTVGGFGLVVDRPANDAAPSASLTRKRRGDGTWGGTILSGFRDLDGSKTPTRVVVFGHSGLDAPRDARHRAEIENSALVEHPLVSDVLTYRTHYLRDPRARTPQVAEQRARREIAKKMATFDVFEASVQGFAQSGRIWTVNTTVNLDDDLTGARGIWLVTRAAFRRARSGGHTTHLRLVPKGALVLEPDPEV